MKNWFAVLGLCWLLSLQGFGAVPAAPSASGTQAAPAACPEEQKIALELSGTHEPATARADGEVPGRSVAPAPLQTVDLDAIFNSVTGGSGNELRLELKEMLRMALANNADIKIVRLEPEVSRTDVTRAWGAFDPKLGFQTQYSESSTPQNTQQYISTGGQNTATQLALIDSFNAFQTNQTNQINSLSEYAKSVAIYANNTYKDIHTSGTVDNGTILPPFPQYQPPDQVARPAASSYRLNDPRIYNSDQLNMLTGLGGQTPLGTRYSLSLSQSKDRNDLNRELPPSVFYPEYTTNAGLSISQPLLKNFGPAANLAGVRIARIQKRIGWYAWQQQITNSLTEALFRYFDLVYSFDNMRVRKEAVDSARLLERQNIQRVEQGKKRASDVWDAQSSLALNVDVALRAMDAYAEAQNNLKASILTDSMVLSGKFGRVVPASNLDLPTIKIDRAAFLSDAIAKRPEYLQVVSRAEQEGLRVRYARNQSYPSLDIQGSYGLTGLQGNYGNSFSKAFGGQGTAYSVGVAVSIPLGNMEGRAALESAKLRQQQAQLAIQKALTSMATEIDSAVSALETSRYQVTAAHDTAVASRKTASAEEKLLEEGKSITFDVVRLQNNASEASSRELAAIAAYRKNVVRLAVSRGKLLEDLGISLETESGSKYLK